MPSRCPDAIVEAVREKLLQRAKVGISKYGVTLFDSPQSRIEFLQHLQDELLDGANYCETLLQRELHAGRSID